MRVIKRFNQGQAAFQSGDPVALARHTPMRVVQLGSLLSLGGALIQLVSVLRTPHSLWFLLVGHRVFTLGDGIHQPCGQAGAVGDFPHLAVRAGAWLGFVMMAVAFLVGQTAMPFMDSSNTHGAWPLLVPMLLSGAGLVVIAFAVLPGLPQRGRQ